MIFEHIVINEFLQTASTTQPFNHQLNSWINHKKNAFIHFYFENGRQRSWVHHNHNCRKPTPINRVMYHQPSHLTQSSNKIPIRHDMMILHRCGHENKRPNRKKTQKMTRKILCAMSPMHWVQTNSWLIWQQRTGGRTSILSYIDGSGSNFMSTMPHHHTHP